MDEKTLLKYLTEISEIDKVIEKEAKERQANLAKPPGALGELELISIRFASITSKVINRIKKTAVVIMSSDNGVVEEGVTPTPQSVTLAQTINFLRRTTGVGALAKTFNSDLCVVDVGINNRIPEGLLTDEMYEFLDDKIVNRKIRFGTSNLAKGPAMTREEAITAIGVGIEAVQVLKARDYDIIGVGEMGIGNTTTSAAVLSAITKCSVEKSVGRGGGLNDEGFRRKKEIVQEKAIDTEYKDIIDILANVGGFDICAMTGAYIGAALYKLPIVCDGYISAVAALCACKMNEHIKDYIFGSHCSEEPGYLVAVEEIGIKPMLNLNMRLGEGSGCVLAFEIIKGALGVMSYMATYEEAQIDENYLELMADAKF